MPKFYNLQLTNPSNDVSIPLIFHSNMDVPFVHEIENTELSVIRFVLPNYDTPIFIFQNNTYYISATYKTALVTTPVLFTNRSPDSDGQYVYEIQHFIDMLNTTITQVLTDLNALETLPTSDFPYFIYDNASHLISFIAHKTYYSETVTNPIRLYLNSILFKKLQGLPVIGTGTATREYQLLVQDEYNNTYNTNYFQMEQQASSFDLMCDFNSVVLTTSMPIQNEYINTGSIGLPILTDYCPNDLNIETYANNIVYNAVFPYRQVEMTGSGQLYVIDIQCYWSDISGSLHQMYLPPGESSNIKIMFSKKGN